MQRDTLGRAVAILLVGVFSGCEGGPMSNWRAPWTTLPERVPGVVVPHERMAELETLSKTVRTADPTQQQEIVSRLAREFREEGDPLMRVQIVRTLAACPNPATLDTLRAAMDDSTPEVRIAACAAWGQRGRQGNPEAIGLLSQRVASDTDTDVRLAATRALGETGSPTAMAGLGVALDDRDPALQRRAVLALREVSKGHDLGNDVNQWRQYVRSQTPRGPVEPAELAHRPGESR